MTQAETTVAICTASKNILMKLIKIVTKYLLLSLVFLFGVGSTELIFGQTKAKKEKKFFSISIESTRNRQSVVSFKLLDSAGKPVPMP